MNSFVAARYLVLIEKIKMQTVGESRLSLVTITQWVCKRYETDTLSQRGGQQDIKGEIRTPPKNQPEQDLQVEFKNFPGMTNNSWNFGWNQDKNGGALEVRMDGHLEK